MKQLSPERKRTLQLQERVFSFAKAVINACPRGSVDIASRELWRQLVRSAPSASQNLEEADEASSTADFIAKMKIALREAKESRRWLRFITDCQLANGQKAAGLCDEARQISAIFATIVINTKRRVERENKKSR
jgi:four helix bundle protein